MERGETLRDKEGGGEEEGKRQEGGEEEDEGENKIRQCTAEKLHFVYCGISCHHARRYQ